MDWSLRRLPAFSRRRACAAEARAVTEPVWVDPPAGSARRMSSVALLRPLVPIFRRKVDDLVERLTIRLRHEVPNYAAMDYAQLHGQAEAQVRYVLDELAG